MDRQSHFHYPWERRFCTSCGQQGSIGLDALCDECRHQARSGHPAHPHPHSGYMPWSPVDSTPPWQEETHNHPSDWRPRQHPHSHRHFEDNPEHRFQQRRSRGRRPRRNQPQHEEYQHDMEVDLQPQEELRDFWEYVPSSRPRRRGRPHRPQAPPQFTDFDYPMLPGAFSPFDAPSLFDLPDDDFFMYPSMMGDVGHMFQRQSNIMHMIRESLGLGPAFFPEMTSLEDFFTQIEAQHPDRIRPATASALRRIQTKSVDRRMVGEVCAVCQDKFETGQQVSCLRCEHTFHKNCLGPWLRSNNTCPVCRQTVD